MIAEPLLAFFLVRYLRKTLRKSSALPEWDKPLIYAMVGIVLLFVVQQVFSLGAVTIWVWHILLLLIISIMFKRSEFYFARNIMFAVLPIILVSILSELIKLLPNGLYR